MTVLIDLAPALEPMVMGCDWCGGSGTWTDENGDKWPCIKCRQGKSGEDNRLAPSTPISSSVGRESRHAGSSEARLVCGDGMDRCWCQRTVSCGSTHCFREPPRSLSP